ncbi:MFS transporter [Paenibacillus oceani]|uniref:MFS transporter n=1 Tax=Paenibacillus oceani TaxID=2772510 RepID=A0A927C6C9_9BACL|nr:MFS transporter [Paenibacillus oceani]MBD2862183.1 MFS transporter [Paenibacillus oceani]
MQLPWKKTFAIIFSGQIFSILTSAMVQFAVIWHLTETTVSATVLMIAGLAAFLPQAMLGPFIGVWLDRWNRKMTMIAADSAIALSSLLLGAYFLLGEPSLPIVYAILTIRSAATAFHAPAFQAAIPLIAPKEQLTRVAGWNQMRSWGASSPWLRVSPCFRRRSGSRWPARLSIGMGCRCGFWVRYCNCLNRGVHLYEIYPDEPERRRCGQPLRAGRTVSRSVASLSM